MSLMIKIKFYFPRLPPKKWQIHFVALSWTLLITSERECGGKIVFEIIINQLSLITVEATLRDQLIESDLYGRCIFHSIFVGWTELMSGFLMFYWGTIRDCVTAENRLKRNRESFKRENLLFFVENKNWNLILLNV